jgi:hypothetical protein
MSFLVDGVKFTAFYSRFSVDGAATASTESSELRISPSTEQSVDGQLRKFFECHLSRFDFNAVDGKPQVCTTLIFRQISMSPSTERSSTDTRRKFMCAHPIIEVLTIANLTRIEGHLGALPVQGANATFDYSGL